MANLLGQNIGTNYKGILNLGSTINTALSSTLRAITDGDGVASPLQLSDAQVKVETITLGTTFTISSTNGGVNMSNGNSVGKIDFNGRRNSSESSICRIESFYIGDGSNRNGRIDFSIGSNTTIATRMNLTDAGLGLGITTTTASARLHVRGDGTNPILRTEDNAGTLVFSVNNTNIFAARPLFLDTIQGYSTNNISINATISSTIGTTITTGLFSNYAISSSFGAAAGNANYRPLSLTYTINNSGAQTGTATGIFLNATETALNGMGHNLMDLQVGGVSRFRVTNFGGIVVDRSFGITFDLSSRIVANSNGQITFTDSTATTFVRLNFGGTTNAFPALKRNGAALEVRLADDSNFSSLSASVFNAQFVGSQVAINIFDTTRQIGTGGSGHIGFKATNFTFNNDNFNVANASAIVQIDSTTKGFLPPRMTTTQVNAIATPAEGLVVFNTTISHLCVYQSGAWVKLSHSPM